MERIKMHSEAERGASMEAISNDFSYLFKIFTLCLSNSDENKKPRPMATPVTNRRGGNRTQSATSVKAMIKIREVVMFMDVKRTSEPSPVT